MYLLTLLKVLRVGESLYLSVLLLHLKYFSGPGFAIIDTSLELVDVGEK